MRLGDFIMGVLGSIRRALKPCDHVWQFSHIEQEQNLRTGHEHDSRIYRCVFCPARQVIELPTSSKAP